jgi:hypothetical protein
MGLDWKKHQQEFEALVTELDETVIKPSTLEDDPLSYKSPILGGHVMQMDPEAIGSSGRGGPNLLSLDALWP